MQVIRRQRAQDMETLRLVAPESMAQEPGTNGERKMTLVCETEGDL